MRVICSLLSLWMFAGVLCLANCARAAEGTSDAATQPTPLSIIRSYVSAVAKPATYMEDVVTLVNVARSKIDDATPALEVLAIRAAPSPFITAYPKALTKPALSLREIRTSVDAARSKIEDLTVSFDFSATRSNPDDPGFRSHSKIVIKGAEGYLDARYGRDPKVDPRTAERIYSFNGFTGVSYNVPAENAMIESRRPVPLDLKAAGFFQMAMLAPAQAGGCGFDDESLSSLLAFSGAQLRPVLEVVGGHECYVVDSNFSAGQHAAIAWLDPSEGFLPLKMVIYGGGVPFMETTIDHAGEILPNLWLPLHGRKIVQPMPSVRGGEDGAEYILSVDGWDQGKAALVVNTGIKDDVFELQKQLPGGTLVFNLDTKKVVKQ
ncbi:MAG: hypothetical protein M3O30_17060 [Planctomycetota bacterium]|nr:hypothetical protein [Planctomycetota bacterium]